MFRQIDNEKFTWSSEQCFLHSYRALARELFMLRHQHTFYRQLSRQPVGGDLLKQVNHFDIFDEHANFLKSSILKASKIFQDYKDIWESNQFANIRIVGVELSGPPFIAVASSFTPTVDFEDTQIQRVTDLTGHRESVDLIVIPIENGTSAWLHWLPASDKVGIQLASSFLNVPNDQKADAILRIAFSCCENIAISPDWWNSLKPKHRAGFHKRLYDFLPSSSWKASLRDDGRRVSGQTFVRVVSLPISTTIHRI
jgi:hypothetical protein